uniref:Uncharacterized protein n=1 Tax=Octactis speculum TaxID=3111310 RepID=A0A7S2FSD7_9STRA|mmetsp:Transcript_3002/g.3419  ORF Transcript_3002/g.3419 Transcript_3002/m.3419 type:complete len:270 (+) Transcript_3002:3-812(+)
MITQLQSNVGLLRSTVHSFVDVLWRPLHIHLNDTKNNFSEILTELTPSPVSFSLYYDSPGVLRLAQLDSNFITLHSTVTHFNSTFVAPVHTDPSVTTATLTMALEAAESAYYDHEATQKLNDFDLAESKIILRNLMENLPDLKNDETEKSDIVQGLSASITNSAQTRSSDTTQQDALTEGLQTANGELNIATAAVAECTARSTNEDMVQDAPLCDLSFRIILPAYDKKEPIFFCAALQLNLLLGLRCSVTNLFAISRTWLPLINASQRY